MQDLANKTILITGGTGTLGTSFIHQLTNMPFHAKRIIVFSRDEHKQHQLKLRFPKDKYPYIHYVIGNIRDLERLSSACQGVDIIIHNAALKHVDIIEENPIEAVKTNILGSYNLILAAQQAKVDKVIALSTDKAASPNNMYGASKLCAEKLFVAANYDYPVNPTKFTIVRCGNIFNSRGSVVELFLKQKKTGTLYITDPEMTRFSITSKQLTTFTLEKLGIMQGGEVFIPKIPSYNILKLANAIAPTSNIEIIGKRSGEKCHEELITIHEANHTIEFDKYFVTLPTNSLGYIKLENVYKQGTPCKPDFSYTSNTNFYFLNLQELQELIEHN